jgi:hypothetical protein
MVVPIASIPKFQTQEVCLFALSEKYETPRGLHLQPNPENVRINGSVGLQSVELLSMKLECHERIRNTQHKQLKTH